MPDDDTDTPAEPSNPPEQPARKPERIPITEVESQRSKHPETFKRDSE